MPFPNELTGHFAGLYYINAYGHEMHPVPTPEYISGLGSSQVLVYSCGSLWTRSAFPILSLCMALSLWAWGSIIPCLALRGVASAIARSRTLRVKVLFRKWRPCVTLSTLTRADFQ